MLSKGFKEQIYDVYRYLPPETQVCVCTASTLHLRRVLLFQVPSCFLATEPTIVQKTLPT